MLNLSPPRPLQEIVGIGPVLAEGLSDLGFKHDIDLLAFPETVLMGHLAQIDGLNASVIADSLLPQARILRLPGSSGSLAHALMNDGFRQYSDFLGNQTVRIAQVISDISDARSQDDQARASNLACEMLLTAVQLAVTGGVRIIIKNGETHEELAGAEVTFDGDRRTGVVHFTSRTADERGIVDFEGIAPYPTVFHVSANGFRTQSVIAVVKEQRHATCTALMSTVAHTARNHDEFQGGLTVGSETLPTFPRRFELSDLPTRPPVYIESIGDGQATLGSLWFREEFERIVIPILRVPIDDLPDGAKAGDVLLTNADGWRIHPDDATAAEFRQELMRERGGIVFQETV